LKSKSAVEHGSANWHFSKKGILPTVLAHYCAILPMMLNETTVSQTILSEACSTLISENTERLIENKPKKITINIYNSIIT